MTKRKIEGSGEHREPHFKLGDLVRLTRKKIEKVIAAEDAAYQKIRRENNPWAIPQSSAPSSRVNKPGGGVGEFPTTVGIVESTEGNVVSVYFKGKIIDVMADEIESYPQAQSRYKEAIDEWRMKKEQDRKAKKQITYGAEDPDKESAAYLEYSHGSDESIQDLAQHAVLLAQEHGKPVKVILKVDAIDMVVDVSSNADQVLSLLREKIVAKNLREMMPRVEQKLKELNLSIPVLKEKMKLMEEVKKELSISDKDKKISLRRKETIKKLKASIVVIEGITSFLYGFSNMPTEEQKRAVHFIKQMKEDLETLQADEGKLLKDYPKVLMDTTSATLKQLRKKIEAYEAMRGLIRKWLDLINDGDIASTPFFRTIGENQKDAPRPYNSIIERLGHNEGIMYLMQSEINVALAHKQLIEELLESTESTT